METYTAEDILERVNELIVILEENELELYVAVELAHQLHDEIVQAFPVDEDYDQ